MTEAITITRLGAPTASRDAQGNFILAASTTIDVDAIAVAPLQGDESADQVAGVSTNGYTLYLPFGTDVRSTDTITIRGVDGWQVEADAGKAAWASPFTSWTPGTVAVVRRAS